MLLNAPQAWKFAAPCLVGGRVPCSFSSCLEASRTPRERSESVPRRPKMASRRAKSLPRGPQEGTKRPPKRAPGGQNRHIPFGKHFWCSSYSLLLIFRASKTAPEAPEETQDGSRGPQDGPRGPQDGPRSVQDGPSEPQEGPRRAQKGAKRVPGKVTTLGRVAPNTPPEVSRTRPPEAPEKSPIGPERPRRGSAEASKRPLIITPRGPERQPRRP